MLYSIIALYAITIVSVLLFATLGNHPTREALFIAVGTPFCLFTTCALYFTVNPPVKTQGAWIDLSGLHQAIAYGLSIGFTVAILIITFLTFHAKSESERDARIFAYTVNVGFLSPILGVLLAALVFGK